MSIGVGGILLSIGRAVAVTGTLGLLAATDLAALAQVHVVLGTSIVRVDGTSGRDDESFGSLDAAVITPDGMAIIADRSRGRLVLLRPGDKVRPALALGRVGSGPGEMREPKSLQLSTGDTLTVLDRALSRFTRYVLSAGGLELVNSIPIAPRPEDACRMLGRLVVLLYDPAHRTLLRFARTSNLPERFAGRPFSSGSPFFEAQTSGGRLLCAPDAERIVATSFYEGEVLGFNAKGDSLWHTVVPDLVPWNLHEISGGGIVFAFHQVKNVRQAHFTASMVQLDRDHLLLQYGLVIQGKNREADLDFPSVESVILRLADGRIVGRQRDLPVILAANGSKLLAVGGGLDFWAEVRPYRMAGR